MWMLLTGYLGSAFLFYAWMYRSAKPDPYAEEESAFYVQRGRAEAVHSLPRKTAETHPAASSLRAGIG